MENNSKTNTNMDNGLELLNRSDVESEFGEAIASKVSADKSVTWAKFVLTDDMPNGNGQRIPAEEFDNIIRTGIFKPVKMGIGEIKDGHEEAHPLGVITHLAKEGNKIIALAALWDKERLEDVSLVKELVHSNKPVNVSWEVLYDRKTINKGISDLYDTVLRAVTIVGMPAYAGRTQFIAIAANKWTKSYIASLPDTSFLFVGNDGTRYFPYRDDTGKIDVSRFQTIMEETSTTQLPENTLKGVRHTIKKLQSAVQADAGLQELLTDGAEINLEDDKLDTELEAKVTDLTGKLAIASEQLVTKDAAFAELQAKSDLAETKVIELTQEVEPLREFKLAADEATNRVQKLSAIKEKFVGLKLEKTDEYFNDNAEKLLSLDEAGLDFLLQELVAFKDSDDGEGAASKQTSGIPNIPGKGGEYNLLAGLRERNKK